MCSLTPNILKRTYIWRAIAVVLFLNALAALSPAPAQGEVAGIDLKMKLEAVQSMQTWLTEIDGGNYAKSWSDSAKSFQKALTSDKWVAALTSVRTPLGQLNERTMASAMYQTSIPTADGKTIQGQFVIAQFDSSFENLIAARETVTFEKEADGVWRASGYYIKPRL